MRVTCQVIVKRCNDIERQAKTVMREKNLDVYIGRGVGNRIIYILLRDE